MVERSDTTGHRSPSPSAPWRGASPVPPQALASLPGCRGSRSRGSPVVSSLRSSTTGYTLGSLRLHGRWTPGSLWMRPPAPMPRSPIRYHRVLARRLPPLTCLGIESFRTPYARIWAPTSIPSSRRPVVSSRASAHGLESTASNPGKAFHPQVLAAEATQPNLGPIPSPGAAPCLPIGKAAGTAALPSPQSPQLWLFKSTPVPR